jgi:hypothetical protein
MYISTSSEEFQQVFLFLFPHNVFLSEIIIFFYDHLLTNVNYSSISQIIKESVIGRQINCFV